MNSPSIIIIEWKFKNKMIKKKFEPYRKLGYSLFVDKLKYKYLPIFIKMALEDLFKK